MGVLGAMKSLVYLLVLFYSTFGIHARATVIQFNQLINITDKQEKFSNSSKTQLVVFWATWCKECKKKLINTLPEWNKIPNVNVISINIDANTQRAQSFITKEKIKIPVYQESDKFIQRTLKVNSVPYWAIFQKNKSSGWDLIEHGGGLDEESVMKKIKDLG